MDQLDDYRLERSLGTGPRGCVYRALDARDRPVAVKLIRLPEVDDETLATVVETFDRDVGRLSEARLPGVIRHLASGREADGVWMAMELRSEPTLRELIDERPLEPEAVVELVTRLADALDRCHEQQVVARNLRPANVFVTSDGPLLTDLVGVDRLSALLLRPEVPRERALWAAPEVVLGLNQQPASNRWALAQIAYLMIERELPREAGNLFTYLHAVALEPLVVRTDNRALAEVWRRGLHIDPRRRFESATELASALAAALGIGTVPEPTPVIPFEFEVERLDPLPEEHEEPRVEVVTLDPLLFGSEELASEPEDAVLAEPGAETTAKTAVPAAAATHRLVGPLGRGDRAHLRLVPAEDPTPPMLYLAEPVSEAGTEVEPVREVSWKPPVAPVSEEDRPTDRVADPRPVILPDPEPASGESESGRGAPGRDRRSGLWHRVRRMFRSSHRHRVSAPGAREFYLEEWEEGARREQEFDFGDAKPLWPEWRLSVRTERSDAQVWVDGEYSGPASEEVVVRAKSGAGIDLELRTDGRTVARTRVFLHPMMERVWHADGEPDAE